MEETTKALETPVSAEQVSKLIRHHVYGSMALGLVPIPMVDFLGITGIQINMVRKMANFYDIPFSKDMTKNMIISLIGGAIPSSAAYPFASSIKFVPIIGQSLGAVSMPIIAGASTYAVGKVFYRHFASGGTFLTFDPEKAKAYYEEMFQKGKNIVKGMKADPETASAS
jgi:uncharacterized protein (DUF697 family)